VGDTNYLKSVITVGDNNTDMIGADYTEYRCTACKKEVKNIVLQCSKCVKSFFHPGCASKHRTLKGNEIVKCEDPFIEITVENEKAKMRKTTASGRDWD